MRTKEEIEKYLKLGYDTFGWSESRLTDQINSAISTDDYNLLDGKYSTVKAQNLLNKWGQKEDKPEGELLGYNLIKKEFEKQALEISGCTGCGWGEPINLTKTSKGAERLKDAGVLSLWFEPVYKKPYKIGDIVVVRDDFYNNRVCMVIKETIHNPIPDFRKEELITVDIPHNKMGGYNVEIDKIIHAKPHEIESFKKPRLPVINGYQGVDTGGTCIKYGCAHLPKSWFLPIHGDRHIKSLTLTNDVEISEEKIVGIRSYLLSRK